MQNAPATGNWPMPPTFKMVPTDEEKFAQMMGNAQATHDRLIYEAMTGKFQADAHGLMIEGDAMRAYCDVRDGNERIWASYSNAAVTKPFNQKEVYGGPDTPNTPIDGFQPGDIVICVDTEKVRRNFRTGLLALAIVVLTYLLVGCDLHDPKLRGWWELLFAGVLPLIGFAAYLGAYHWSRKWQNRRRWAAWAKIGRRRFTGKL